MPGSRYSYKVTSGMYPVYMRRAAEARAAAAWREELWQLGPVALMADMAPRPGAGDWAAAYAEWARRRRGRLFLPQPTSEAAAWHGWNGRGEGPR